MAVDLLQQVGLTKYEAEAYFALLREGPLTGYELGRRSNVPLPRAYDVLDRLTQRGLALVQPGDPPRYRAQDFHQFLAGVRTTMEGRLDRLARLLAALPTRDTAGEIWVIRGDRAIAGQALAMIEAARETVGIVGSDGAGELRDAVSQARSRGCRVEEGASPFGDLIVLAVDGRETLLGAWAAAGDSQAVLSRNPALVEVATGYIAHATGERSGEVTPAAPTPGRGDWVAWEESKQRQLWRLSAGREVA